MNRPNRRPLDDVFPIWFKIWFAVVAVLGIGFLGLIVWAIIAIVGKVTR